MGEILRWISDLHDDFSPSRLLLLFSRPFLLRICPPASVSRTSWRSLVSCTDHHRPHHPARDPLHRPSTQTHPHLLTASTATTHPTTHPSLRRRLMDSLSTVTTRALLRPSRPHRPSSSLCPALRWPVCSTRHRPRLTCIYPLAVPGVLLLPRVRGPRPIWVLVRLTHHLRRSTSNRLCPVKPGPSSPIPPLTLRLPIGPLLTLPPPDHSHQALSSPLQASSSSTSAPRTKRLASKVHPETQMAQLALHRSSSVTSKTWNSSAKLHVIVTANEIETETGLS